MNNIIRKIAMQNRVSVKEVRRDFEEMIRIGMSSTEPEAIVFWSQFGGETPTPEQFIAALSYAAKERIIYPVICEH